MTSRPKDKGTRFETAVAGYARMRTEDAEIRRFSLSGVNDHGDVGYVAEVPYLMPRNVPAIVVVGDENDPA